MWISLEIRGESLLLTLTSFELIDPATLYSTHVAQPRGPRQARLWPVGVEVPSAVWPLQHTRQPDALAFALGLAKYQLPKACFSHTRKRGTLFIWLKELFRTF